MKLYTPADFLVIGHLDSSADVHGARIGTMYPHIDITPNSYKFLETKNDYVDKIHKIRIYIANIINDNINLNNTIGMSPSDRDNVIFNHYKDDMFIIRPSYHKDENGTINIAGKSKCVYILKGIDTDYMRDNLFTPIPIFSKNNTSKGINTRDDFNIALGSRLEFGTISVSPWPDSEVAYPDGVIWKENDNEYYLYTNIIVQGITVNSNDYNKYSEKVSYSVTNDKAKVIYKFDKTDLYENNFVYQNSIAFIDFHIIKDRSTIPYDSGEYDNINNIIKNSNKDKSEGTSLYSPVDAFKNSDDKTGIDTTFDNKYDDSGKLINNENNAGNEKLNNNESKQIDKKQTSKLTSVLDNINTEFIKKLEHLAYISKPKLYYKLEDLINFHTAMKCNGLVVLAGLSGTGKSALINLYAKALGIYGTNQYKFIPVRPFWNDDSDLLGYVDTVHSIYQPADSGLVNTLVEASHYPDKLYLITFDEMNLARVEYYFSQFLSILEKNPNHRCIQLYNPDLQNRLYNSNKYPARIKISDNILFTGTINLDESTHKFSDKVLDRSNIINLKLVPYYLDNDNNGDTSVDADFMNKPQITKDDFNNMKYCNQNNGLTTTDLKMLWNIHKSLNHANSNLGVGRRVVNQIDQYLCNIPQMSNEPLNHGRALDLQLVQRVFTKVRGSSADIGNIMRPDSGKPNNLVHILNINSNISDFDESKQELSRKYDEVKNYGFTI